MKLIKRVNVKTKKGIKNSKLYKAMQENNIHDSPRFSRSITPEQHRATF